MKWELLCLILVPRQLELDMLAKILQRFAFINYLFVMLIEPEHSTPA